MACYIHTLKVQGADRTINIASRIPECCGRSHGLHIVMPTYAGHRGGMYNIHIFVYDIQRTISIILTINANCSF